MRPAQRAIVVVLVLVMEGFLLTLRFDSAGLFKLRAFWWGLPLAYVSELPRFAIAVATVLVLSGRRLTTALDRVAREHPHPDRIWRYLALHIVLFGAFVDVTRRVFEGPSAEVGRWAPVWLGLGVGMAISLLPTIAHPRALRTFLKLSAPILVLSLAVGVMASAAGYLSHGLSRPLQGVTSVIVYRFVRVFRGDAFLIAEDFTVGTPRFDVEIAPACSGYEGMGLITVFIAVFLFTQRRRLRFPMALVLLPLGVLAAAIANVVRLAGLVLIGEVSPRIAQGGFHSYAGAVLFSLIAVGTATIALRVSPFAIHAGESTTKTSSASIPPSGNADVFLAPIIAFITAQLITGLVAVDGIDSLYFVRVVFATAVLWFFRRRLLVEERRIDPVAVGIGLAVAVVWLLLVHPSPERRGLLLERAHGTAGPIVVLWLLVRAVGGVVVVPIVEELAFRGYLMRRLDSPDFELADYRRVGIWPITISSAVFGVLHSSPIAGIVAGATYALTARRKGLLIDAVVAHATTNAALVAWAVLTGRWEAWL